MKSLNLADATAADIRGIVAVREKSIAAYPWTQVDQIILNEEEQLQAGYITGRLRCADTLLMNSATLWARAIYPLLALAEQEPVQAWSQIPLRVRYPHVELQGVAAGVLGTGIVSMTETTYHLIVSQTDHRLAGQDPRPHLLGQLLAAARVNWELDQNPVQTLFGCYTVIDTWKFLRVMVQDVNSNAPTMVLEPSREYVQKLEAEAILKILKRIVTTYIASTERISM